MRDRGTQFRPRHLALDRLPHRFQRQLLLMLERIQQHADGRRELAGVLGQPRITAYFSLRDSRGARASRSLVINTSKSSSASSTALASSDGTVATSVASRRGLRMASQRCRLRREGEW
jgi:NADPH-dependent curcumin reductase CurA